MNDWVDIAICSFLAEVHLELWFFSSRSKTLLRRWLSLVCTQRCWTEAANLSARFSERCSCMESKMMAFLHWGHKSRWNIDRWGDSEYPERWYAEVFSPGWSYIKIDTFWMGNRELDLSAIISVPAQALNHLMQLALYHHVRYRISLGIVSWTKSFRLMYRLWSVTLTNCSTKVRPSRVEE